MTPKRPRVAPFVSLLVVLLSEFVLSGQQAPTGELRVCRLMGLFQVEREADEVALAVGTTGWNPGRMPLDWHRKPDARHPFIAQQMYKMTDERILQIGVSGVKHGYFVAANDGCDGRRCEGPSGQILHPNCTDTYGPMLNASQLDMGPRFEVNPWTAGWDPASSHLSRPHSDGPLVHRLRVKESALAPQTNTAFLIEAYYVHHQNADPNTSAAWQRVEVRGMAGGEWDFDMSAGTQPPTAGFALRAWTGATFTELSSSSPVRRGVSDDGRALLAVKVRQLGPSLWRYEYALLNIDMDRKIKSLEIPVQAAVTLADPWFSAPHQPDEITTLGQVATNDEPWRFNRTAGTASWSTETNPLRWGVMYNFAFTSDLPPAETSIAVEPFSGTAARITGQTLGPVRGQ
jgi:hypothetical protein